MLISIILISILILIASISNAIMDLSSENRFKKPWWNKTSGAENKWAKGNVVAKFNNSTYYRKLPTTKYWWYLGLHKPDYQERFPFSTTILVGFTDGWHFAQLIFHTSWQMAISISFDNYWWIAFIIIKILFSLVFEMFYGTIKKIKK